METHELESAKDYRLEKLQGSDLYLTPADALIASAAAEPHALYVDGTGAESFARTASRLMEMRFEAYLAERHKRSIDIGGPG